MNSDWSEKNKNMQKLLGKEASYKDGISQLLALRKELFGVITEIVEKVPAEDFCKQPLKKEKGGSNATLAWSIWHLFRIEDIVAHELVVYGNQVLFSMNYAEKIGTSCITPGNEMDGEQIAEFSKTLNIEQLYAYARAVYESSDFILGKLDYTVLKSRFTEEDKERLAAKNCVDLVHPDSCWLIDYWCGKDVRGLLKMPFSRHWIMHIEAMVKMMDILL